MSLAYTHNKACEHRKPQKHVHKHRSSHLISVSRDSHFARASTQQRSIIVYSLLSSELTSTQWNSAICARLAESDFQSVVIAPRVGVWKWTWLLFWAVCLCVGPFTVYWVIEVRNARATLRHTQFSAIHRMLRCNCCGCTCNYTI